MSEHRAATQVTLTFNVEVQGAPFNRGDFHAFGDRVMEELLALEACNQDVSDADVSTDAAGRTIEVGVLITSGDQVQAHARALDVIRTALHAVGAATPGWPTAGDVLEPQTAKMARTVLA